MQPPLIHQNYLCIIHLYNITSFLNILENFHITHKIIPKIFFIMALNILTKVPKIINWVLKPDHSVATHPYHPITLLLKIQPIVARITRWPPRFRPPGVNGLYRQAASVNKAISVLWLGYLSVDFKLIKEIALVFLTQSECWKGQEARTREPCLAAKSDSWPTASKKMGLWVLKQEAAEFCQESKEGQSLSFPAWASRWERNWMIADFSLVKA